MKKINKQAGFTLIELIMVIVILGVLSAFALPRFADLGGNAREASINGLGGSVKAAANIAHAQSLANGAAQNDNVTLEGQAITMINFYPTADAAGITEAAQVSAGSAAGDDYTLGTPTAGIRYELAGGTDAATCSVLYEAAGANGTPTITVTVTGC